jgi:predicted SprT family Zn-dependent metalloprotease
MDLITELEKAKKVIKETCEKCKCPELYRSIQVHFNSRYTRTMGKYRGTSKVKTITFSAKLWPFATEEQRHNTVVHETVHAVTHHLYGVCDHGGLWVKFMEMCGENAHRQHTVDTSAFARKKSKMTVYECKCESGCSIGPTRAKRIKQGVQYRCVHCGMIINLYSNIIKQHDQTTSITNM